VDPRALDLNLTAGWRSLARACVISNTISKPKVFSSQDLRLNAICIAGKENSLGPNGERAGYYVRIAIKMHPDIKVEQTGGSLRANSLLADEPVINTLTESILS
jgi:hypothetical protein